MNIKILLAGDGGQGVQTIADLICRAAFETGLQVSYIPNYGLEQRGGVSLSFVQIADEKINYPKFTKPDILVILSPQARVRTAQYRWDRAKILDAENYQNEITTKSAIAQNLNIFFLNLLADILQQRGLIEKKIIFNLLEKKLSKKSNWEEIKKVFNS